MMGNNNAMRGGLSSEGMGLCTYVNTAHMPWLSVITAPTYEMADWPIPGWLIAMM